MDMLQQSPINLDKFIEASVPTGYLRTAWAEAVGKIHQGDHGVEVVFRANPSIGLTLDGKSYALRNFHFHVPSEHLIRGEQAEAEVHLVHQNPDDASIAVLGVFLRVDENCSAEIKRFTEAFSKSRSQRASQAGDQYSLPTDPHYFIPKPDDGHTHHVFRYQGSLTTEPYSEPVSWLVFQEKLSVPSALLELLDPPGPAEPQRARGVQPLNGRLVLGIGLNLTKSLGPGGGRSAKKRES